MGGTRRRQGRAAAAATALVGVLLVGAMPGSARAAWTAPVTLSAAGQNALAAQVAIDSQGDAVFTWQRFDGTNWRIQARARSASGTLSAIQNLSAPGQSAWQPQVDVDANGDAVFTWRRFDGTKQRIQARARSATGALSAVQILSAAGQNARDPQVAVDADGDAVFTWQRFDGTKQRIQARARSAAGALSAVQTLSAAGRNAREPDLAVTPGGKAVFAWLGTPLCCERVEARVRSAAGALSSVQTLSPPPGPYRSYAISPRVGVDAPGNAVFTWGFHESSPSAPRGASRVQVRARSTAGVLSPIQNLVSPGMGGGGYGREPQVAVDPTGDAVFAWGFVSDYLGTFRWAQARARSASGTLSPTQSLTPEAGHDFGADAQVGIDGVGNAVITWYFGDGVAAQVRSAGGSLGPLQTFPTSGLSPSPQVAVNGVGDAVVTWKDSDSANTVIRAAAGP